MAFIEGLKERNAALTRIKNNLKIIKTINKDISFLKDVGAQDVKRTTKLDCKYVFANNSEVKIKIPIELTDEFVLNALKQQKERVVEEIKNDVKNHRISLEQEEEDMLFNVD